MFFSDKERQYAGEEKNSKSWYVSCTVFCSAFLMYLIALLPIFVKRGLPFFYYGDYNVQQVPFYILAHRAVYDLLYRRRRERRTLARRKGPR